MVLSFFVSKYQNDLIPELLQGRVPDLSLPLCLSRPLFLEWKRQVNAWQFLKPLFREASQDTAFPLPLMPLFAALTLEAGVLPSPDLMAAIVALVGVQGQGRIYSCWSAWLREYHVGMYLAHFGQIEKPLLRDLTHGIDWLYNGKPVAVCHTGDRYLSRKGRKCPSDIVKLYTRTGDGLHLVSPASMDLMISCSR